MDVKTTLCAYWYKMIFFVTRYNDKTMNNYLQSRLLMRDGKEKKIINTFIKKKDDLQTRNVINW